MDALQSSETTRSTAAFLAELIRLQREVRQLDRQLDSLEAGMRRALNDLARQVYEAAR